MKNEKFLDEYEKELLEGYELHGIKPDGKGKKEVKKAIKAAEATFRRNKRISVRISEHDLEALKYKAAKEGLPYSAMISSILHKYITGQI